MDDDFVFYDPQKENQKRMAYAGGAALVLTLLTFGMKHFGKKARAAKLVESQAELPTCEREIRAKEAEFRALFSVDCLMFDSNIWMDSEADVLFNILQKVGTDCGGKINCLESQIAEMDRLKSHKEKGYRARLAQRRLESFAQNGLLRQIDDRTLVKEHRRVDSMRRRTDVDGVIVDYLLKGIEASATARCITDDKGLRVRLQKVVDAKPGKYKTIAAAEIGSMANGLDGLYKRRKELKSVIERLQFMDAKGFA